MHHKGDSRGSAGSMSPGASAGTKGRAVSAAPQRIAFFLWNAWFFRNFAGVIADLAARGHRVDDRLSPGRDGSERATRPRAVDRALAECANEAAARALGCLWATCESPVARDRISLLPSAHFCRQTNPADQDGPSHASDDPSPARPFRHDALREPALRILIALERALPRSAAITEALRDLRPRRRCVFSAHRRRHRPIRALEIRATARHSHSFRRAQLG